jgi:hypothetical protein
MRRLLIRLAASLALLITFPHQGTAKIPVAVVPAIGKSCHAQRGFYEGPQFLSDGLTSLGCYK